MSRVAVGIDLGTSSSSVAVWRNDRVEMIADEEGNFRIPSAIAFDGDEISFGYAARNDSTVNGENVVSLVKRFLCRKYRDAAVQQDLRHCSFEVIEGPRGDPLFQVVYKGEVRHYLPQELLALEIGHLKNLAEKHLGRTVTDAVLSMPSHFTMAQRQALRDAGQLAGINVLQVSNEASLSALAAFGDRKDAWSTTNTEPGKARSLLVYDLGGGSLSVSLLEYDGGVFEVLSTAGERRLGGEDFDNRMMDYFLADIRKRYHIDLFDYPRSVARLRLACERAKRSLSSNEETVVELESLVPDLITHYSLTLTRTAFDEMCLDLFARALQPLDRVLRDARPKRNKSEITEVLLVGGSSRIPRIQELLKVYFECNDADSSSASPAVRFTSISPDESTAMGAAILAAIQAHDVPAEPLKDVLLLDGAPASLSFEISRGRLFPLIPRHTTLPVHRKVRIRTIADNQQSAVLRIYEGEQLIARNNLLVGRCRLDGLPTGPAGSVRIDLSCDVDVHGEVTILLEEVSTGASQTLRVFTAKENDLSALELRKALWRGDRALVAGSDGLEEKNEQLDEEIEDVTSSGVSIGASELESSESQPNQPLSSSDKVVQHTEVEVCIIEEDK